MIDVQGFRTDINVVVDALRPWQRCEKEGVIIVFRKSNHTETTFHLLHSCMHLIAVMEASSQQKRIVVDVDRLLQDSKSELQRIVNFFSFPQSESSANDEHSYFAKIEGIRKDISTIELQQQLGDAATLYENLFHCLAKLASDEWDWQSDAFNKQWQTILTDYYALQPFYLYLDKLQRDQKTWLRKLRHIQKSIIWKLSWPLRMLEDAIRNFRRARRTARRS